MNVFFNKHKLQPNDYYINSNNDLIVNKDIFEKYKNKEIDHIDDSGKVTYKSNEYFVQLDFSIKPISNKPNRKQRRNKKKCK